MGPRHQYRTDIHLKARAASVGEAILRASDAVWPALKEAAAAGAPGPALSRSQNFGSRQMPGGGRLSGEEGWYDLDLSVWFDSDERAWDAATAWLRAVLEAVCGPDLRLVSLSQGWSEEWSA